MSPSNDRKVSCSDNVEDDEQMDEIVQTHGSRVTVNVSVEDQVNDSTPRIVTELLNSSETPRPYGELTSEEW